MEIPGHISVDKFDLSYKIEGEGKTTIVIGSSIYRVRILFTHGKQDSPLSVKNKCSCLLSGCFC